MIVFDHVSLGFNGNTILKDLSFHIEKGMKISLMGRSGSGKSSIMKTILGFHTPQKGTITIKGQPLDRNHAMMVRGITSWVPQDIWTPLNRVEDFLRYPFGFKSNQHISPANSDIHNMLENLRLKPEILKKNLREISGGEKQRIALCSSLLLQKEIVLWDEPTSALDEPTRKHICDFVTGQQDLTLLVSAHDTYWIQQSDLTINTEDYYAG